MCHPAVAYVAMAAISAGAAIQQGRYQKGVGEYNARVAENQAKEERNRATEAISEERQRAMQMRSQQRAIAAARGAQIDTGTALGLQEDTEMIGRVNAQRIARFGEQRASALESEATLAESAGRQAMTQGVMKAGGSLIGGASSAAGSMSSAGGSAGGGEAVAPQWYSSGSQGGPKLDVNYGMFGGP